MPCCAEPHSNLNPNLSLSLDLTPERAGFHMNGDDIPPWIKWISAVSYPYYGFRSLTTLSGVSLARSQSCVTHLHHVMSCHVMSFALHCTALHCTARALHCFCCCCCLHSYAVCRLLAINEFADHQYPCPYADQAAAATAAAAAAGTAVPPEFTPQAVAQACAAFDGNAVLAAQGMNDHGIAAPIAGMLTLVVVFHLLSWAVLHFFPRHPTQCMHAPFCLCCD